MGWPYTRFNLVLVYTTRADPVKLIILSKNNTKALMKSVLTVETEAEYHQAESTQPGAEYEGKQADKVNLKRERWSKGLRFFFYRFFAEQVYQKTSYLRYCILSKKYTVKLAFFSNQTEII